MEFCESEKRKPTAMSILSHVLRPTSSPSADALAALALRLGTGVMLLPHGIQKVSAYAQIVGVLQEGYGLPYVIAALVPIIELLAPAAVLLGLGTRVGAALIAVLMIGAIPFHLEHGFFMNWFGTQAGEGYQFHVLAVGASVALAVIGGGRYSVDALLARGSRASA